jgi:hypothetical protein
MDRPLADISLADDLSNLDDVVERITGSFGL